MESKTSQKIILGAVVATAGLALTQIAFADKKPQWVKKGTKLVKCAGVVKAGMNDCGANAHSC